MTVQPPGAFALSSGQTAIDGIAEPALHQLAVGELDVQRRLEPRDATRQPEIMEWRRAALAPACEEPLGGPHAEAPLDRAAKEQATADALADDEYRRDHERAPRG